MSGNTGNNNEDSYHHGGENSYKSDAVIIQSIGKIEKGIFETEFGKLQTDEVVLTGERDLHIKTWHLQDYSYFEKYRTETVNQPDIILVDGKHDSTVFMVKKLPDTNINVVIRLALDTDNKGLKNSIMTFYRIRNKNLGKLIKRNKLLYKRD